jgi:4-diphosphocytidyl-2-C-methyl-D-erythritol kinase
MLFFPNAKINIGLNVVNKRSDGYHDIETLFFPVGLSDILEFTPSEESARSRYTFTSTGLPLDCTPNKNLCIKAYQLLSRDFPLPSIKIVLHKIIPMGAGLGGGSSDGAFMLKLLNTYFNLGINEEGLCKYASNLGSDCAFFIKNRPLLAYGRGNEFEEIKIFPHIRHIVVVHPAIHLSTARAYAALTPKKPETDLKTALQMNMQEWRHFVKNDFEAYVFDLHPEIEDIKNLLYQKGAVYASMSGSGSSVYGLFSAKIESLKSTFPGYFVWEGKGL